MAEPSDLDLWRCMEATLRTVLPAIEDVGARTSAAQLAGLAHHALTRPEDLTATRAAELSTALDGLAENPLVFSEWPIVSDEPHAVLTAVSRVLIAAIDDGGPAAAEVRERLRSIVVRHVDDDLAVTGHLLAYVTEPPLGGRARDVDALRSCDADEVRERTVRALATYRAASPLPLPLLDEAAAWLDRHAAGEGTVEHRSAVLECFTRSCEQLACLLDFAGPCPSPELAITGTARQQRSMRRLADLVAR